MSGSAIADRAGRMDVLLKVFGNRHIPPGECIAHMSLDELDSLENATEDDRLLVNACLELETEIVARDWCKLERLMEAGVLVGRYPDPMLSHLSMPRRARAISDLIRLGWIDGMHLLP